MRPSNRSMDGYEIVKQRAAEFMLKRGWKRLTAKRREGLYSEPDRRKQSLFELIE
jgi:hypothetical protein